MTLLTEKALSQFYSEKGIAVDSFHCPYMEDCKKDVNRPLTHGAEAHVGSKYGDLIRVAVVSLDTGGGSENLVKRQAVIESLESPQKELNQHMKGTVECLQALFNFSKDDRSVLKYFAMINAAKCSATDGKRNMVPSPLYRRCRQYAQEELTLLKPEVIIAQGARARDVLMPRDHLPTEQLENVIGSEGVGSIAYRWLIALGREYLRQVTLKDGTHAIGMITPHPSARQGQWHHFERTCLEPVTWMIKKMLN